MSATVTDDVAWIRVEHESAIGAVRRAAVDLAVQLGLGESRANEAGIVVTEIATNQMKHAGGGAILLRACRGTNSAGLEVVGVDNGPGMRSVSASMVDGHSTSGTLGIGLGAMARLATDWDVFSAPGRGTVVTLSFGLAGAVAPAVGRPGAAGLTRPMAGEEVCGDGYALRVDGDILTGMLADGLGHGPLAALATAAAVRAFRAAAFAPPVELLRVVHPALHGTRGAAVAIVQLVGDQARYAGIGNVSGLVLDREQRRGMISHPGIVGSNARTFRETTYEFSPDAVVVMHSDGVTNRMVLADGPHLLRHPPLVVAATVLRDFGVRHDDASVLVVSGIRA